MSMEAGPGALPPQEAELGVNREGHLTVAGCDAVELAHRFGTPLYVLDELAVRRRCRAYRRELAAWGADHGVIYASKAFMAKGICRLMDQEGMHLDVVSGGELFTALSAAFPPERIFFHGNNKTPEEITYALEVGIGRFVVDNPAELELLDELAAHRGVRAAALLRITPGIEAHTHEYVRTGSIDSKFGFTLTTGEAMAGVRRALELAHVELKGLHCHIGSQILETEPFALAARVMVDLLDQVRRETGVCLGEVDLGGGLGIRYTAEDRPPTVADFAAATAGTVRRRAEELGLRPPRVLVEPGRSIVGEAGVTLYTVGSAKEVPGVRYYLGVDGGMGDNPRPALYGAVYRGLLADRPLAAPEGTVTVAGHCCESGDVLIRDLPLPHARRGEILAVLATGAYNYSMASNYNRFPRPAAVLVREGQAKLLIRRETYQDVAALDELPEMQP